MPKKIKQEVKVVSGPTQAEIARLLADAISLMQTQVVTSLLEKHETLDLDETKMETVQNVVREISSNIRNSSTDQLLKYY